MINSALELAEESTSKLDKKNFRAFAVYYQSLLPQMYKNLTKQFENEGAL